MNTDFEEMRELSWEDVIENDSSFTLLEEGEYDFTVVGFERARFAGSAKLPPCPQANLKLQIVAPNGSTVTIDHALFLHTKTEGFLCAFFTSIGQRKHGEKLQMNWGKVIGSCGRCEVYIDKWTGRDGAEMKSNKIRKFIEPKESVPAASGFVPGRF